jgi:ATP-dependent DNA ligase
MPKLLIIIWARRDPIGIRLLTRNGHDWAPRYPLIVEAVDRLKVRSCLIDGEAVACEENGLAVFERLRRKPSGKHVFLYAFDLLELDGQNLRRDPLEVRKATLASMWPRSDPASGSRAYRGRRPNRLRPCLQAWPRRQLSRSARIPLPFRVLPRMAQNEERECCSND